MNGPEDLVGCTAILMSLEKRWLVADQSVFIAAVIINPFFRVTPFTRDDGRFITAHIKSLLVSLYLRFFQSPPPTIFHTELHDYLMGSGQYRELESTCTVHILQSKQEVCLRLFKIMEC